MTAEVDPVIVTCAVRYALGRRSYMPALVADEVRRCWPDLGDQQAVIRGDVAAWLTDGTITVTEDEMRSIPDRHQIAITGFAAEPPDTTLAVRVAPLPPCPACNDDGVLSTLDGDTIGPCPECAP